MNDWKTTCKIYIKSHGSTRFPDNLSNITNEIIDINGIRAMTISEYATTTTFGIINHYIKKLMKN